MLPLIQSYVTKNAWMGMEELVNFVAVSESTPGPFAINIATYVGAETAGSSGAIFAVLGSLCSTLGVVLPSFIIILIVSKFYNAFRENKIVNGCMNGLKPVVVGLIGAAVLSFFSAVFFPNGFSLSNLSTISFWVSAALFGGCLVLALKKVHPILIIIISAAVGIASGYLIPIIS